MLLANHLMLLIASNALALCNTLCQDIWEDFTP
jgi:hypothetical protein